MVDNVGDVQIEGSAAGRDAVQTTLYTFVLGLNIEDLAFTGLGAFNGTGNILDNLISGGASNDSLFGGSGNDTLNGSAGSDALTGGAGDDVYFVDSTTDVVTEASNSGSDEIRTSLASYTLTANFENLLALGSAPFTGAGNASNNSITGNAGADSLSGAGGNDTLIGAGGNDLLNGGTGSDRLYGGAGNDLYLVDNVGDVLDETGGSGLDTVQSSISFSLADPTHAAGQIENLTLTGTAATDATGNALNNVLTGNAGANLLAGLAGADTVIGGSGLDTITYAASAAAVWVSLLSGTGQLGDAEGDSLSGIENVTGSSGNDTVEGNAGNNVLAGGAGEDWVGYWGASQAVTVNLSLTSGQNTGGSGTDTISNFENLAGSAFNDNLTGTATANRLWGYAGKDVIGGGGGDDTINGDVGDDQLTGGTGNDHFVFRTASEGVDNIIDFVAGTDSLDITASGFGGGLVAGSTATLLRVADLSQASSINGQGYFILDNAGSGAGTLYWDATGGTSVDAVTIAQLHVTNLTTTDLHIL